MRYFIISLFLVFLNLNTLHAESKTVQVFKNENIRFNPAVYPDGLNQTDNIFHLANGRIAIHKIVLPTFKRNTQVSAKINLTSNGDPWDKSGSCFIIPKNSAINMIDIANNSKTYPTVDADKYENLVGIVPGNAYQPTVELMRFMTPFGVGHFSAPKDSLSSKRKPVYIDKWASEVVWEQDVSHLISMLQGEVYIGVFIDTWTEMGYNLSLELSYNESKIKQDKLSKSQVLPLVNTVYYLGQSIPDIFARKDISIPFTLPKKAKNVKLKYITTGHGGHSGGDEFVQKENIIFVDNQKVLSFIPWRDDCASFRRFNPSTGVWLRKRTVAYIARDGRKEKEVEEPLGSSDLSRSNWCPGSQVTPETIDLKGIEAGEHTLRISIPEAQPSKDNELNHWLVSAYLVWEE